MASLFGVPRGSPDILMETESFFPIKRDKSQIGSQPRDGQAPLASLNPQPEFI